MIYFFIFFATSFLVYFFSHVDNCKLSRIGIFLSIVPLIGLATFRDDTVGIDVLVYIKRYFDLAVRSKSFLAYSKCVDTEIGYKIVNYLSSRVSDNIAILHCVTSLLITVPILKGIYILKDEVSVFLSFVTYLCFFFNYNTMSQVRQGIAMSFIFLGIILLYKENKRSGYLFIILACTFHLTAVVGGLMLLFFLLVVKRERNVFDRKTDFAILISFFILLLFWKSIIDCIMNLLPSYYNLKYGHYLVVNRENIHSAIGISYITTKILAVWISNTLYRRNINNRINRYLLMIQFYSLLLIPIAINIDFGYRMLRYIDLFEILVFAQFPKLIEAVNKNRIIMKFVTVLFVVSYWITNTLIRNQGGTLPYSFRFR